MIFPLVVSSLKNVNQLILVRYYNQLMFVEQYFTNIASVQNMGVLYNKFDSTKSRGGGGGGGDITDISNYHNVGIWSMD